METFTNLQFEYIYKYVEVTISEMNHAVCRLIIIMISRWLYLKFLECHKSREKKTNIKTSI